MIPQIRTLKQVKHIANNWQTFKGIDRIRVLESAERQLNNLIRTGKISVVAAGAVKGKLLPALRNARYQWDNQSTQETKATKPSTGSGSTKVAQASSTGKVPGVGPSTKSSTAKKKAQPSTKGTAKGQRSSTTRPKAQRSSKKDGTQSTGEVWASVSGKKAKTS